MTDRPAPCSVDAGVGSAGVGLGGLALRCVAALCAGAGGLLAESAALRRHALLMGGGTAAATAVLACFLAGLGVGSYLIARRGGGARPLRLAAIGYALVALLLAGGDSVCSSVGTTGVADWVAWLLVALFPGLAAVVMGLTFPLLFAGVSGRFAPSILVGCNVLGSVGAAWAGGNVLVPEFGIAWTNRFAAGAYLMAAALLLLAPFVRGAARRAGSHLETAERDGGVGAVARADLWLSAASGALLLGYQILLLRRLPFFLEGFQPTLAGVLSACLLWSAVGAFAAPWLARSAKSAPRALLVAALFIATGAVEWLGPWLGKLPASDDFGLHVRVLVCAGAAAAVPCLAAGAVVPTLLARQPSAERDRRAGGLFMAQGIGALCGALGFGVAGPLLFPGSLFVSLPACLALFGVVAARGAPPLERLVSGTLAALAVVFGAAGPGTPWSPEPPIRGSRYDRPGALVPVAFRSDGIVTASVALDRRQHGMVLFTDEFRAAETGPGTDYMRVLGHLPFLLNDGIERAAVIALGTGTTAAAVVQWGDPKSVDVVEISPAVLSLVDRFSGDGPLDTGEPASFRVDPRTRVHLLDGRRWLGRQAPGSLDLLTMEPLLPYAPGTTALYSKEFYELARSRLASGGLLVQWVPTHAMPESMFRTLLASFDDSFEHTSVWLVDQSTLLVGSVEPHLPETAFLDRRFGAASADAAATLHAAGVTSPTDLRAAFVGAGPFSSLEAAPRLHDERPFLERIGYWSGEERLGFLAGNLAVLGELVGTAPFDADVESSGAAAGEIHELDWATARQLRLQGLADRSLQPLDPTGEALRRAGRAAQALRAAVPGSVLLHSEETLARRLLTRVDVERSPAAAAARRARAQLRRDPGDPLLWLAAAAGDGPPPAATVRAALALDPTLALRTVRFRELLEGAGGSGTSPLDDLGRLERGADLVAAITREQGPRGAVLRAAFPVACARAFLEVAQERPLERREAARLAPLLDPHGLRLWGQVVRAARGPEAVAREVLPAWRSDLPLTAEIEALGTLDAESRGALAAALGDRRDRAAARLLGERLQDDDRGVRLTAAASLRRMVGDKVLYDPDGTPEQWRAAARALSRAR